MEGWGRIILPVFAYPLDEVMGVNFPWKSLLVCLLVPLGVGALSGLVNQSGMAAFSALEKPPLTPPDWVFPIVWGILYLLMGLASWLIHTSKGDVGAVRAAMRLYGLQLGMNFFWPLFFFTLEWRLWAFVWLMVMWALILVVLLWFYRLRRTAGWLMLPYLVWTAFAGYLNLGVVLCNLS